MFAKSRAERKGEGSPSTPRRVPRRCLDASKHHPSITNNRTQTPIGVNPVPAVASACTPSRGTVGCLATVFEVRGPRNGSNVARPCLIVSAQGSPETSRGLNRTPNLTGGFRPCL